MSNIKNYIRTQSKFAWKVPVWDTWSLLKQIVFNVSFCSFTPLLWHSIWLFLCNTINENQWEMHKFAEVRELLCHFQHLYCELLSHIYHLFWVTLPHLSPIVSHFVTFITYCESLCHFYHLLWVTLSHLSPANVCPELHERAVATAQCTSDSNLVPRALTISLLVDQMIVTKAFSRIK